MAFLRRKTHHDHMMGDAYSAFQKYVRMGDIDNSLYWGYQIGKEFPNALRKRLIQHSLEDVGHLEFAQCVSNIKSPTWEKLIKWICAICRLPKTRAAAWLNRVAVEYVNNIDKSPSNVVKHAAEALQLHRDKNKLKMQQKYGKECMKVYADVNNEILAIHTLILMREDVIAPSSIEFGEVLDVDLETVREIPDWMFDKHTSKGKRLGRGYEHFFDTMIVSPKLFETKDPFEDDAKRLYLNGKEQRVRHILYEVNPPDGFTDILQAQPVTGRHKPKVWFATDKDGNQVVIKGVLSDVEISSIMKTEKLKILLGLPHTNARVVDKFIVQDCLVDYSKVETKVVSTKIETNVRVAVPNSIQIWEHDMLKNNELAYSIMIALLFRKIAETNDTCTRNFIVIGSNVYSIDDAYVGTETPYMWKTKLVTQKINYSKALDDVWDRIKLTIDHWSSLVDDRTREKLNAFKEKEKWRWN
jgi:hypothetical protein